MASTVYSNVSTFSRFNLDEDVSDIQMFVNEYRRRVNAQLAREQAGTLTPFVSFHENKIESQESKRAWIKDNQDRFFKDSPNLVKKRLSYLSEMGYINSMIYSPCGKYIIVGHSTGLIQVNDVKNIKNLVGSTNMSEAHLAELCDDDEEAKEILDQFKDTVNEYYRHEKTQQLWYYMFTRNLKQLKQKRDIAWVKNNQQQFLVDTPNQIDQNRWYSEECGYITSLAFSRDGERIIVGHANGLIQMRHGHNGNVLATLRNIQFPPKPIHALEFSKTEERVCYAACTDGTVYRIEIPFIDISSQSQSGAELCIRIDPALEWLNTQFYGSPGTVTNASPFISQRTPVLALGITADSAKMVVGYADASVKIYDMATQEAEQIFKMHKLRLQFIPKKLQRVHSGQVCAVRCHNEKPYMFATAAWDKTLRIWDTRCKVGCMMTFEGVNVCHDAIDLNRDQAISGSWQTSEALCTFDLIARKRLSIVRVQNRRPDVDGEYIYACRFWRSSTFNRKGKYGIIGGSGTGCVEVINLHNRYITCSYPAPGTVLALSSYEHRIAFGGTAPVFNIVTFHDPKHEEYNPDEEPPYDFTAHPVTLFERFGTLSPRSSETAFAEGEGEGYDSDEIEEKRKLQKKSRPEMDRAELSKKSIANAVLSKKSVCTDISKTPFKASKIVTVTPSQHNN